MATGYAAVNLGFSPTSCEKRSILFELLLRYEAWLDRRRSARILYRMDDQSLADIGLSRADVEGLNIASWQDHLPSTFGR